MWLTERILCKKRFSSNILFFAAPDAILQIFSVVNVNSILSLNHKKTSVSNRFEQLYLGLQFVNNILSLFQKKTFFAGVSKTH